MIPATSILIVDDHALFREGLGRLLSASLEFEVVGQCSTLEEAAAALATTPVDVILLDYDMGEQLGSDLLTTLRRTGNPAKVLMVTGGLTDEVSVQVLEAGAAGIILKHSSPDQLVLAIRQIARGESWLDKGLLHSLVSGQASSSRPVEENQSLTNRQGEVLRGILDGLTNKEIAWNLKSSESAVKAVIQELFRKAGVRTRSQLVRIAIENHSTDWLRSAGKG
jgi:two-component system, NarL family, nitrate/nitrite response regulator NarL